MSGEFVWENISNIILPDAYMYPISIIELPVTVGTLLGSDTVILNGMLSRQYYYDITTLQDSLRLCEFKLGLLLYENKQNDQNQNLVSYKERFYSNECSILRERISELERIKNQLEVVKSEDSAHFVCYYVSQNDMYDGMSAAYGISYDEAPIVGFSFPSTMRLNVGDKLQMSIDDRQMYMITVTDVNTYNGICRAKAVPDKMLWNDYELCEIISSKLIVYYEYNSNHYSTLIPTSAIKVAGDESFIYIADEKHGYWSNNFVVRSMPVTILEQSESYTAISERVFTYENIIISNDVLLQEGEYVMEKGT